MQTLTLKSPKVMHMLLAANLHICFLMQLDYSFYISVYLQVPLILVSLHTHGAVCISSFKNVKEKRRSHVSVQGHSLFSV